MDSDRLKSESLKQPSFTSYMTLSKFPEVKFLLCKIIREESFSKFITIVFIVFPDFRLMISYIISELIFEVFKVRVISFFVLFVLSELPDPSEARMPE